MGPRFVAIQVFIRNHPSLSIWAAFDPWFDAKHAPHRVKTMLIVTARSTLLRLYTRPSTGAQLARSNEKSLLGLSPRREPLGSQ